MRLVFLDTGTLWLLAKPKGKPRADPCRQWAIGLLSTGVRVFVPETRGKVPEQMNRPVPSYSGGQDIPEMG